MKRKYEEYDGTIYPLEEPRTKKQMAASIAINIGAVIVLLIVLATVLNVKF